MAIDVGTTIRVGLVSRKRTQVWLIEKLAERGIKTSSDELSKVLNDARKGKKADLIKETALAILAVTPYDD